MRDNRGTLNNSLSSMFLNSWSPIIPITTTTTISPKKCYLCTVSVSSGITLNLPDVSTCEYAPITIIVNSTSTGTVTLSGNGSNTIDGLSSRLMWAGESCVILSNGTSWNKIAGKSIPMKASIYRTGNFNINNSTVSIIPNNNMEYASLNNLYDLANNKIVIIRPCDGIIRQQIYSNANLANQSVVGHLFRTGNDIWLQDDVGFTWGYFSQGQTTVLTSLSAGEYIQGAVAQYSGSTKTFSEPGGGNKLVFIEIPTW